MTCYSLELSVPELEGDSIQGKSVGYIFLGSSPAGLFSLSDICRTGVKDAMRELKQMGIKTVMLTGDCYAAANHVQDQLGGALDEFQAELLPEDKATIIKGFQKEAPTAMIGDGLNDAPALATADIGISMGISGSALANETGHVILMTNDIGRIPKAARLARRVRRKIIENMIISIGIKGAIVALAIAGYPLVWAAVLADAGTCLLVILNSMLLLRGATRRNEKKCCKSSTSSHAHHHHKNKAPCCKSEKAPQLCCSDIESQKECRKQSCSSEVCVQKRQPFPSGSISCANNQCSDSIENNGRHSHSHPQCCSSKMSVTACQSAVSESKSCGSSNCSDSIHMTSSCHSSTNSLIHSSDMSAPRCQSTTSSSKSCGSDKNCCRSHEIPQTCSTKKSARGCQSELSGPKSCGNSKCSDSIDNNIHHSHSDHQTCTSKVCAPQSSSATSSSRTCGNTKCSDTTRKNSCHSHANSESCSSKMSGPACQNANSGSRSCGNNKCLDSSTEHGVHSVTDLLSEEKNLEQESLDLVRKDLESNHDHSHGCCDEEHNHHPNITDISETGIQETSHCDSTNQTCQTVISGSMTCGNNKSLDSVEIHGCHSHAHPPHKEKDLEEPHHSVGHGCSDKEHEHDHSHPEKAYDNCATQDCCFSVQDHVIDISENGSQGIAHCDSIKQSMVIPSSCKHTTPQDQVSHSRTTATEEELAKLVRRCCKYRTCHVVRSGCRKHAAECGPIARSTINILRDNHHHHDCSGRKVCSPLEKRHIGGCCESFRKECCPKNNHFASSFGGGLSEIVLE